MPIVYRTKNTDKLASPFFSPERNCRIEYMVSQKNTPVWQESNDVFSKHLIIDLKFDTATTQILWKLQEVYQLKHITSFSKEADFGHFEW